MEAPPRPDEMCEPEDHGDPGQFPPDGGDEFGEFGDPREMRRYCFRLIREVTGRLGWKYKLWIPAAVLLSAVHLLPPRFLQYFTEGTQSLAETPASSFLWMLVIFGMAIAAVQWIGMLIDGILSEWLRLIVSIGLKRDAVTSLTGMRLDALDTAQRGDWMTRLTGDLFTTEEFLTQSIPQQIAQATMLVGTAVFFFYYSGTVALIPLVAAAGLAWVNIAVQRRMGPTLGQARQLEGGVFQSMIETFEGLRTIRTYGSERFTVERLDRQLGSVYTAGMRITRSMAALMGTNEMVGQLVITGVLTLVAYKVRGGALTAEEALVYPFYISLFLGSAKSLVASAYDWNRFFVEGGRLAMLLYDDEAKEGDRASRFGGFSEEVGKVVRFSASGVEIAYGDHPPVVRDQDLELSRGEIVALMGQSGCGKSTMTESFAGLRRAASGSFIATLESGETRSFPQAPPFLSAFVEQQPYLFVGTIRENIVLGNASISDDEVWRALDETGLRMIVERRGGLDHVLSDRGRNLSVGQQYRLALCRA
ncbi:MAG TPA: ABC transporter ATP-binding protein [Bacteroidia bacterium]|nr:ABC transporter ATP-binding protein [Bacteroidia bacterium]